MKKTNKKGFTIVELVIVIAVIAILAGVLIPTFSGVVDKANKSAAMQNAKNEYSMYAANAAEGGNQVSKGFVKVVKGTNEYWFSFQDNALNTEALTYLPAVGKDYSSVDLSKNTIKSITIKTPTEPTVVVSTTLAGVTLVSVDYMIKGTAASKTFYTEVLFQDKNCTDPILVDETTLPSDADVKSSGRTDFNNKLELVDAAGEKTGALKYIPAGTYYYAVANTEDVGSANVYIYASIK